LCFVMSRLPMSVVTCPGPGCGKTVLLRSWIGQAGAAGLSERVGWVPAGRGERDPQRFWLSMLAAFRQTAPGLAAGAGGDGGAGPWTAGRSPSGLLADLAPLDDRLWPVVDDA
jgi:LuxR family transcriptional regulator, maltose regulon positive regulatory protein